MRSQAYRKASGKGDQRGGEVLGNNNTTKDDRKSSYYSLSSYPMVKPILGSMMNLYFGRKHARKQVIEM